MAAEPPQGISTAWTLYRDCAATSAYHKERLDRYTTLSLWLSIGAAVLGTWGQAMGLPDADPLPRRLGIAGALLVALSGVASAQAVSGSRDRLWVKCRAAAEALKSAVFLYCAGVPPFDSAGRAASLAQRVTAVEADLQDVELRPGTPKTPPGPLQIDGYLKARVDDQIGYYRSTATRHQAKADFWRRCSLAGSLISVSLGVLATFSLAPWVALMATVTASVTAYVRNQRYESMIQLYQTTARRLQLLKDLWADSGKGDADRKERDSFIERCEAAMLAEHAAWVTQWLDTPPPVK